MAAWDAAESAFLTAAAKVYAALGVAHPSGNYGQFTVDINVDGETYSCRCDCTGVIQCIIRVMGYDPNWSVSSVPGHTGDGWYLTDATSSFVRIEMVIYRQTGKFYHSMRLTHDLVI